MRLFARIFGPSTIGALLAGLAAGQAGAAPAPQPGPAAVPAPPMFSAPEYVMGDPRAPVTIIEYASASCPHCARFDINQFPALKAKYIDTGKARYIFREFITAPEQLAAAGFLLARCSGQANYWKVVEGVFRAQEEIYKTGAMQVPLQRIAHGAGLSDAQVDACLTNKAALDALNARVDQAVNKDKITSTPTFVINGKVFHGDERREVDVAELSATIQPLLRRRP